MANDSALLRATLTFDNVLKNGLNQSQAHLWSPMARPLNSAIAG